MLDVNKIKSIQDAEVFCQGVINDFETGIIDKEEAMSHLKDYTNHIHNMFETSVNRIVKNKINQYKKTKKWE